MPGRARNHGEKSPNIVKPPLKATFHLTIFDITMRLLREDQRHRKRFTR